MVLAMSAVSLAVLILELLCVVTNTGAGHHACHHGNRGCHGHHGHFGGGVGSGKVGRHNKYGGHGGNGGRHDQGHLAAGGHRDRAPLKLRGGVKNDLLKSVGHLNPENRHQPRSSAHSKKKGHADNAHSQTTSREANPVKSFVCNVS